jgi:hypothetical protein
MTVDPMFAILEAAAVPYGGIFNTYEDLMLDLNKRMERKGYKIVKARSHRNKIGGGDVAGNEIVRCDLVCDRGGRAYKSTATKHKTHTKKTGCPWKAKAVNRKAVGGWVLTVFCNEHNHEAGTPEPPSLTGDLNEETSDANNEAGAPHDRCVSDCWIILFANIEPEAPAGPQPDPETSAALQVAGLSDSTLRLTGDTFHQFKTEYRKMIQADRLNVLAQLQLRIAAIYAVQNEDMQRQRRHETQNQRHQAVEASRKTISAQKHRAKRQQANQEDKEQQSICLPPETGLSLTPDLDHLDPNHAPDAIMHESTFQLSDAVTTMEGVEMPQLKQYHGPSNSKKARPYRAHGP